MDAIFYCLDTVVFQISSTDLNGLRIIDRNWSMMSICKNHSLYCRLPWQELKILYDLLLKQNNSKNSQYDTFVIQTKHALSILLEAFTTLKSKVIHTSANLNSTSHVSAIRFEKFATPKVSETYCSGLRLMIACST